MSDTASKTMTTLAPWADLTSSQRMMVREAVMSAALPPTVGGVHPTPDMVEACKATCRMLHGLMVLYAHAESGETAKDARIAELEAECDRLSDIEYALVELVKCAELRGDNYLPHPSNDPLLWSARMQAAWHAAAEAIDP